MFDEECREREVSTVVSNLNQLFQRRLAWLGFPLRLLWAIIDAVEKDVPPPSRRHRRHGGVSLLKPWTNSFLAYAAREEAR